MRPIIYTPRLFILMILLSLFSASSCTHEYDDCFYLTDEVVTKVYSLTSFQKIETFVPGKYTLKQGKNHAIEITGHPRYIDSLSNQVYNNKLSISNRFAFCKNNTSLEVVITLPKIKHLVIDAESDITIEDFVDQEDLYINLNKKSFININRFKGTHKLFMLLREDAQLKSNVPLEEIDSLNIKIEGDGHFNGFNIPAKNVDISILGKGYCEVNAIEKLHVVIKGNANVVSKGMPSLYKSIIGRVNVYFND